jgi:hypothetical protein
MADIGPPYLAGMRASNYLTTPVITGAGAATNPATLCAVTTTETVDAPGAVVEIVVPAATQVADPTCVVSPASLETAQR